MRSFAVIPGAGVSRRMGTSKLLLPWGEITVIEHLLRQWHESCVDHIVLVTRPQTLAGLERSRWSAFERLQVVTPKPPPEEMKASVSRALDFICDQWVPQTEDIWLLAPADLVTLTSSMINSVVEGFRGSGSAKELAIPRFTDKRGHPVLFRWKLASEVASLADHENLRSLVDKTSSRLEISMPGQAPRDLDTWADYESLRPPRTPEIAKP
ncbi:MAG: nucleotidyltransferase family protein [Pirellulales bacterium]|nr:nucleotidyltransferase family protein [Pirellulales bacterium]